jgi:glycine betaine/proline transport system ATP-binding protein
VTEFVRDVSRAKVIQAKAIMREPDAVVYEMQGPRAALHTMDSHHLDAVFLIARDFTLRGILTAEQVKAMAAQGRGTLEEVQVTPALTTSPETYLEEIIPIAAKSEHPVAVVDDNGSLLGEIRRSALLTGISDGG